MNDVFSKSFHVTLHKHETKSSNPLILITIFTEYSEKMDIRLTTLEDAWIFLLVLWKKTMSLTRARVGNEVDKRRKRGGGAGVSPYVGQGFKKVLNMNANGWSRKGCKDVKVAKELKLKGSSLGRTVISGSTGYDELYKCRKRETVEKSHSSLLLLLLSFSSSSSSFHHATCSRKIFTGLKFRRKLRANKYMMYFQVL